MRADDVPEYVQDGVVDCGITGLDIVRERGADVRELARLGFGACTLEVAVHSLVPAADVWRLLPELEAAGASSILLVPVERMLG